MISKHYFEYKIKDNKIYNYIKGNNFDGLIISARDNFAWLTCGGKSGVENCVIDGVVDLLYTKDSKYIIASSIERYRFLDEEVKDMGFELITYNWYDDKKSAIDYLLKDKLYVSDTGVFGTLNVYYDIVKLRYVLTEFEIVRYKELADICVNVMDEAARSVKIGDTENKIASHISSLLIEQGAELPVCLVAADNRIIRYRHPVPTENIVKKYAMLVFGAQKNGLVLSMTRLIHFGEPEKELRKKHRACLNIDATLILNTLSGEKISDIFAKGVEEYNKQGYKNEWKNHHQGGSAGYRSRDYIATYKSNEIVLDNQAFSWNPTITGTKSEDTLIVINKKPEIITNIKGWPMIDINYKGQTIKRPDILVL